MEEDISNGYHDTGGQSRVDIAQFVAQVERFNCMTEPFAFVLYLWDDLRRWRYPVLTVILWVVFNLACVILTQAAVFTLVSLLVIAIALMCLIQLHTRLLDKFLPDTSCPTTWPEEEPDEHTALQTVREFKYSLMQMHYFIIKCNEYLRYFFSLLKWDKTGPSLKFHVELCCLLLCLVVLPTRWTAILLTNWFFLATEDVYKGGKRRGKLLVECIQGQRSFMSVFEAAESTKITSPNRKIETTEGTGSELGPEDLAGLTDSDKLCDTGHEEIEGEEGEEGEEEEEVDDLLPQGDNKPGMVARLMELKRRRKLLANESCFECKTSFSTFLKRRFTCTNCGNIFCSKCCSQKVFKSQLGATAPTAQTETVQVCVQCFKTLNEEKSRETGKEKAS